MNQQDDFSDFIDKYSLWTLDFFKYEMPEEIDQEKEYNQILDECCSEDFKTPAHWETSYAQELSKNDPVAYRCGLADYTDTMREQYFEGQNEEFYPVEKTKEAINNTLEELSHNIMLDQI